MERCKSACTEAAVVYLPYLTIPLQDDLELLDQKKAAFVRAEKASAQLKKEVRLLQEALADNNIIIDKVSF